MERNLVTASWVPASAFRLTAFASSAQVPGLGLLPGCAEVGRDGPFTLQFRHSLRVAEALGSAAGELPGEAGCVPGPHRRPSLQPTGVDPSPTLHHRQGDTHSWLSFATDLQALVTSSNLNDCPRNLTAGLTTVRPPTCRKLCSWEPCDVKGLERHSVLWDPLTDGPGIRRKKEDEDLTTSRKESPSTDYLQIKEQDPYWPV